MANQAWRGLAVGATLLTVLIVGGFGAVGCSPLGDDPKRTFSLPNDTGHQRLVRRCDGVDDCRFSDQGVLVEPGEAFEFEVYFDESRSYVVGDPQVEGLGCFTVHVADGTGGYPRSLSDLQPCPTGTPETSE